MTDKVPKPSTKRLDTERGADLGDDEPITGVYPASRDFVREVNRVGLWKTSWALFVTAVGIIAGTLWAYRAAAAEARDAGIEAASDVKRQADATQRELERFESEVHDSLKSTRESQGRTEQKFDRLLERMQIPNPAPAPKDGGR
jgi:hypothetical protein